MKKLVHPSLPFENNKWGHHLHLCRHHATIMFGSMAMEWIAGMNPKGQGVLFFTSR